MSKPMTKTFTREEMVMRVVGPIKPVGDHSVDRERFENIQELLALIEGLLWQVSFLSGFADRPEASMALIGKRARRFMDDLCE